MPSAEEWLSDLRRAQELADECARIIQERKSLPKGTATQAATKLTAGARRKLTTLANSCSKLRADLTISTGSDNEKSRRSGLLQSLDARRQQLSDGLRSDANRANLLTPVDGVSGSGPPQETDTTATMSNTQLLQLQHQVIAQQDQELDDMEEGVNSIRHIAGAINSEVTMHTALLDDLDRDMDGTQARLVGARKQIQRVMKRMGMCKQILLVVVLAAVFGVLLAVFFDIIRWRW